MANPPRPASPSPARDHDAGVKELTALLLEVLRNVNHEVGTQFGGTSATRCELVGKADDAVEHFRAIARSLRTPADVEDSFGTAVAQTPPR